jgi:hypothetical protein
MAEPISDQEIQKGVDQGANDKNVSLNQYPRQRGLFSN